MATHEFALSDLAARLLGTDATLATSLRDILTAALQELISTPAGDVEVGSRSCGRDRSSRSCSSRAVGSIGRCGQ